MKSNNDFKMLYTKGAPQDSFSNSFTNSDSVSNTGPNLLTSSSNGGYTKKGAGHDVPYAGG